MTDREKLMQIALDALDWKLTTLLKKSWENHHIHEVIKALRDRLAQPEPKTNWMRVTKKDVNGNEISWFKPMREWVGLTDEEYETLKSACHLDDVGFDMSIQRLCLAIEAKLRSKNT